MAGNYERGIYNQLMEAMARLDAVEKDLQDEKVEHKEDVDRLNTKIYDRPDRGNRYHRDPDLPG